MSATSSCRWRWRSFALAGLFTAWAGWACAQSGRPYPGLAVSVVDVKQRCFVETIQVTGVVAPINEVAIRPDKEGSQIAQVRVEPGDTVIVGQILARLSAPPGAPTQDSDLTSPVAGVVTGVSATLGAYASPAAPDPLFRVMVNGELELRGGVQAGDLSRLTVGQPAVLHLAGVGPINGVVTSIAPGIDAAAQLGTVAISVGAFALLRPGLFARADVSGAQRCALSVPLSAVLYTGDGAIVQAVVEQRVEIRPVTIGLMEKEVVEIREGLQADDLIIAHAGSFLRAGDLVRPIAIGPTPAP